MPETIIELHDVAAHIQRSPILRDISLDLRKGEHLGIIGANGSGKSTLLRLIDGSLWPTPGRGYRRYHFDGQVQTDAVRAKTRITLVGPQLQDTYVRMGWDFPAVTVVETGIRRTQIPRLETTAADRRRALSLLSAMDVENLAERAFLELSRGEQRRVLLARALAFEPQVLLLDEQASGLDQHARAELDRAIAGIADKVTIVATAHDATALPDFIHHRIELRDGTISRLQVADAGIRTSTIAKQPVRSGEALPDAARRSTTATSPLVSIRSADFWLGERCVLANVNWDLNPGDHWLITGQNGAGKSTFLRALHGQIRPARGGSLSWPAFGNPRSIRTLRRHIAWISPELQASWRYRTTVAQCIASGFHSTIGQIHALNTQQKERRDRLLEDFELTALADRPLSAVSYGQARRALLARTFASEPALILLDEPWEGLDPATTQLIARLLRDAMNDGMHVVCASHIGDGGLDLNRHLVVADGAIRVDASDALP